MDRTPGKRPAAGAGAGAAGTAGAGNARQPAPAVRRKYRGTPTETPRHPGGNATALPGETRGAHRAGTPRPRAGNGRHPGGKRAASRRETGGIPAGNGVTWRGVNAADHRPPGSNAAGQRPSGRNAPLAGQPAAERMPERRAGRACPELSLFPGRPRPSVGGADEPDSGPAGGAARTDRPAHFQITNSEIANTCSQHRKRRLSIHLHASYSNVISCCR
jgi:hypothetical protein